MRHLGFGIPDRFLQGLPGAIWIPSKGVPAVYRGTPYEMVASMAKDMADNLPVQEAVHHLLKGLAENRRLVIGLPGNLPDDTLTRLFVYALLDTGIAKPMPMA